MNAKRKEHTVGSLYAGIGGICRAFIRAGATVLWANEFDKYAQKTYKENFGHELYPEDISILEKNLKFLLSSKAGKKRLKKPDILTSGFPCQAFSIAGHRLGFEDLRGLHFFKTMTFLKKIKPKAYLFENVKNLQSHNKGDTLKIIKREIHKAGYSYIVQTLNTMTHANIPQNRERVFIIGFKGESAFNNEEQGKKKAKKKKTIATDVFLTNVPKPIPLTKRIEECLEKNPVNDKYYCRNYDFYKKMKPIAIRRDTVYQWRRRYTRENKNNVCPTLTANMGTGGHNVPIVLDKVDLRKLTPLECAILQGFDEKELRFPSDMSDSHLYKQIGNSVTVPLVESLANIILLALREKWPNKRAKAKFQ